MGNITSTESYRKAQVLGKCWEYLLDNFHKFSEDNKIKVSISLVTKDMPTVIEGDVKGPQQIVIIRSKEELGNRIESIPGQVSVQP
jgi:hypothetical protein